MKELVAQWFKIWNEGNFQDLPVADDFRHISPFGTIEGKDAYMAMVNANKENFLGNTFEIVDTLYGQGSACVRYKMNTGDSIMEISEWLYAEDDLISEIVSYYDRPKNREDLK